ncbi:MAG: hypothetical protein AB7O57_08150 [Hyphomicrobiaceae bacterium]
MERSAPWKRVAVVAASTIAVGWSLAAHQPMALAQAEPKPGAPGDPLKTIPEKIEPKPVPTSPVPEAPPGSLSDHLSRNQGVIDPPKGVDPQMPVPAPNPIPGKTPVIPPPGSPGNPSPVIPK